MTAGIQFVAAATALLPGAVGVTTGEGLAVLEGLKLACNLGFDNIAVESNCLCLVNFVNEGPVPITPFGFVVSNLLDVLHSF